MLFGSTFSVCFDFITIVFVYPLPVSVVLLPVSVSFLSSFFFAGNILPIAVSTVLIGSIYIGSPPPPLLGSFPPPPPPPSGNLYCGFSPVLLSYCPYPSPCGLGISHGIARISSSICLNSSSSNSISSLSSS